MDGRRFDDLTRSIGSASSRRGLLKGLAAVCIAGLTGRLAGEASAACPPEQVAGAGGRCVCKTTGRPPANGVCPCPSGRERCAGACVDPRKAYRSDAENCGACGHACAAGEACVRGSCALTCAVPTDCPVPADPCQQQTCINGVCGAPQTVPDGLIGRCESGRFCAAGVCVRCTVVTQCPDTVSPCFNRFCRDGECGFEAEPAGATGECSGGEVCCGDPRVCTPIATDPANCGACDFACAPDEICAASLCADCTDPGQCPQPTDLCQRATCIAGACGVESVPDNEQGGCGAGRFCSAGICVQCTTETQCPTGSDPCQVRACQSGSCTFVPVSAGSAGTCTTGQICCGSPLACIDPQTDRQHCDGCNQPCLETESCIGGACQACTSPSQCPQPTEACREATCVGGVCGIETAADNSNVNCSSPFFCSNGNCVECVTADICPFTPQDLCQFKACIDGRCTFASFNPGEAGRCGGGQICCTQSGGGIACTNTSTNRDHCGSCGQPCNANQFCSNGTCTSCQSPSDCLAPSDPCQRATCSNGLCGTEPVPDNQQGGCGSNRFCSSGSCVECTNVSQCGFFPNPTDPCAVKACVNNLCTFASVGSGNAGGCTGGQVCCGTPLVCTNTQEDEANCGTCGHACDPGQGCNAGICTGCTTETDCPISENGCEQRVCNSGVCGFTPVPNGQQGTCPGALRCCFGGCADINGDPGNCGPTCAPCPGGQACSGGVCFTP